MGPPENNAPDRDDPGRTDRLDSQMKRKERRFSVPRFGLASTLNFSSPEVQQAAAANIRESTPAACSPKPIFECRDVQILHLAGVATALYACARRPPAAERLAPHAQNPMPRHCLQRSLAASVQ
ncbi:uncharacterized protein PSANT_06260 [Moesziomyces antarcticus]|uniref:Uncharacterized protein n=1 Tax=Pseudozyma antarctica TaxID=84753 RepID=A0A5C3FYL2_PSEA2|nr:uncharacterized protein PSANT_06260 [Moesziomyces antarcticus]